MITRSEIFPAGTFGKPHGISGEITASLDPGVDLSATDCVVVEIDGIFVPFFISSLRPKGADTVLLTLDGLDSDEAVKMLVNHTVYLREAHRHAILPDSGGDDADGGVYACDLVGFDMLDGADGSLIGRIGDIDDSTANVLFIVSRPDGSELMVPAADEFITDLDLDKSTVTVDLPEGLL